MIAFTTLENTENARIDGRFGRCQYFALMGDDGKITFVPNGVEQSPDHGAGIQAAQKVADSGAKTVITGHVGPKAFAALERLGIVAYEGASGTIETAHQAFKSGQLTKAGSR